MILPLCEKHFTEKDPKLGAYVDPKNCVICIQPAKRIQDQPPAQPNASRPIWELVIEDMKDRDRIGRERYGTPLQANNGRDALVDAYQEALDLAVYLRQAIEER